MFTSEWREMIKSLRCDRCDIKYTGDELIYTDFENDYCRDCFEGDESVYELMTSRERTERYCREGMNKMSQLLGLTSVHNVSDVAIGGMNYDEDCEKEREDVAIDENIQLCP